MRSDRINVLFSQMSDYATMRPATIQVQTHKIVGRCCLSLSTIEFSPALLGVHPVLCASTPLGGLKWISQIPLIGSNSMLCKLLKMSQFVTFVFTTSSSLAAQKPRHNVLKWTRACNALQLVADSSLTNRTQF